MNNELYLEECKIDHLYDGGYDQQGNKKTNIFINCGNGFASNASLSEMQFGMLKTIYDCDEAELKGKGIMLARVEGIVRAIGYQGLYIPAEEAVSEIMSENGLCELLACNVVKRVNKKGQEIISYGTQLDNSKNR